MLVQLAAAGADETTRARLARIGIAGILIFPVLGFNLLYTFGAMIVITFVSLVSRIFEGPSTTASSTTTAGQVSSGNAFMLRLGSSCGGGSYHIALPTAKKSAQLLPGAHSGR